MRGTFNGFMLREELTNVRDNLTTYGGLTTLLGLTYDTRREAEEDLGAGKPTSDVLEVSLTVEIKDEGDESKT